MSETTVLSRELQQVQAPPFDIENANAGIHDPYSLLWTTADVDEMPDVEGVRYEILRGDLFVSKQPNWEHQAVCTRLIFELQKWCEIAQSGQVVAAPGVLFSKFDNVVPDVVWISNGRLASAKDEAGHLLESPELMIEVISYGKANIERDRETKLEIYNRYGTEEYWIADWRSKRVQIHRRVNSVLQLVATRLGDEVIDSPLMPGFSCPVSRFFN
jgi:Uma2 family endonuclease